MDYGLTVEKGDRVTILGDSSNVNEATENVDATNLGRIIYSSCHKHFEEIDILHPKTRKRVKGSICRLCNFKFIRITSGNQKRHLKAKHPDLYDEVQRQDEENSTFNVVEDNLDLETEYDDGDVLGNKEEPPVESSDSLMISTPVKICFSK